MLRWPLALVGGYALPIPGTVLFSFVWPLELPGLLGVDLSQFVKKPLRLLPGRSDSGGTLEMQLIKTVQANTDVLGLARYLRKLRDIVHAPVLALVLDEATFRRWFAGQIPLTSSGLHGLDAAAVLVVGRPQRSICPSRRS